MHPTVARVVEVAAAAGLTIDPVGFPQKTRTAEDAAEAIGVDVGQIVKSLVFQIEDDFVIALVSGGNRLDTAALARADGRPDANVRRPDADQVRMATGFAIGGIPPFGHTAQLPTFIDQDLLAFDVLWAAAGTPHHNFSIKPADLVRLSGGVVSVIRAD